MASYIQKFWKSFPEALKPILVLFFVSRLALIIIGVTARAVFIPLRQGVFPWVYSSHTWLAIWGVWDSGWYLHIAQHGYSSAISSLPGTFGQASYAFFPLYPLLMHLVGVALGNYFIAGLVISNLCLLFAAWYLYGLTVMDEGEQVAGRAVKYLFLFPVAFIFSGVFSESLFLALALASLFYAKNQRWWLAGILGGLCALTRSVGVLLLVPLGVEFYLQYRWGIGAWLKLGWPLLLVPLGLTIFGFYNQLLTGNFFSFLSIQSAWHRQPVNPLRLIYGAVLARDPYNLFSAIFALICLAIIIAYYKKIRLSYWLFALLVIVLPMFSGLESLPRYTLAAFPLFIVFAKMTKRPKINKSLTVLFLLLQGFFMALWTIGLNYIK